MATDNRGTVLLNGLVSPKVHTQASIARAVGVTPEAVRQWIIGQSRPKYEHRKALHATFGIPLDAWDDDIAEGEPASVPGEAA